MIDVEFLGFVRKSLHKHLYTVTYLAFTKTKSDNAIDLHIGLYDSRPSHWVVMTLVVNTNGFNLKRPKSFRPNQHFWFVGTINYNTNYSFCTNSIMHSFT